MGKCKKCSKYVANDNEAKGTCLILGGDDLIENNSTITDTSEPGNIIYHAEVGENFGCIHFEPSLFS